MKVWKLIVILLGVMLTRDGFAWQPVPLRASPLASGLKFYLLEDHRLPLFQVTVTVRGGAVHEPIEKAGLAGVTAHLWVTGGTEKKTPQELDEWLDERAIRLSATAEREWIIITISALADQWRETLDFLSEVLTEPRWDPERFHVTLQQSLEAARRQEDQPELVLARSFQYLLYGEKTAWGKTATPRTIHRIRIHDLKGFHQKHFHSNRMVWTVAGDFSSKKIGDWLKNWGENLKPTDLKEPDWEILPLESPPKTVHIRKKLTQAFIEVGQLALQRHAKEQYAYGLLQYILGGEPFTSRLSADIRSRQGLAYTVHSAWETSPIRGFFKIHVETRAEAREQVLQSITDHLKRIAEKGDVTPQELSQAKQAILNKYIFWFASPYAYVVTKARVDMLGYPEDYLESYPRKIRGVTLGEIQEVAKKFIRPEGLKTVIVGPE